MQVISGMPGPHARLTTTSPRQPKHILINHGLHCKSLERFLGSPQANLQTLLLRRRKEGVPSRVFLPERLPKDCFPASSLSLEPDVPRQRSDTLGTLEMLMLTSSKHLFSRLLPHSGLVRSVHRLQRAQSTDSCSACRVQTLDTSTG